MAKRVGEFVAELINKAPHGSARKLAEACGVSNATISKWKTRQNTPDVAHWPAIETYFGLEAGYLSRLDIIGTSLAETLDHLQAVLDRVQEELDELRRALPPQN